MDSHQRPLDFQSNALLLSYLNNYIKIEKICKKNKVVFNKELNPKNNWILPYWNTTAEKKIIANIIIKPIKIPKYKVNGVLKINNKFNNRINITLK